ncbi:hypothetical protein PMAYCL1PPCAC_15432 [Pristionchus mayeri]|uniref:Cytochrome P450 n=1 Tax=Pristionchus mayeri TaxID=1317129 RepID=A0AAN5HY08_9BILA|nr:hypothetical protein PMAYCL1PPCAC_15432 [Pristionchus mayeri]
MQPHLWFGPVRWISAWQKEHDDNVNIAHDFTTKVIEERMELLSRGEVDENKKAFLDMLILEKERSNLSMEDIREEVDTFMFAGQDTTSAALGWTVWCLANHSNVQQLAYEEIQDIFDNDVDRDCSKEDLARLTYLERCIKESLRLFPPVPFIARELGNDLQMGPYLLPREATLMISPYLVHRNESIYPNPERYDPERFLPENIAARHPYDFIPFSAGPRNCIGQRFAMNQLKISLSLLLRNFRFRSDRDFNSITILAKVVLKPREGINVIMENR